MIDLTTKYLGMNLRNPIVASASPLGESLDNIRRLEDHGIGAIVLPSLFEEQLDIESEAVDSDLSRGAEEFAEAVTYFPDLMTYNLGPDGYLNLIHKAKASVRVPIIASLNGVSPRGWIRYAREMEQAGADAIELNIYSLVADPGRTGTEVEQDYCDLVCVLTHSVQVPVAVKLSHFFTAAANIGKAPGCFRGRRPCPVQSFLSTRSRYRNVRGGSQPHAEPSHRTAAASPLGSHYIRARRSRSCDHGWRAQRHGYNQVSDGRSTRGNDGVSASEEWDWSP